MFKTPPLPFMGNKRNQLKNIKNILENVFYDGAIIKANSPKEGDKDSVLRGGEVSAKTVFDAVKERDPLAVEVAEKFGKYLGDGLASIACVVNPEAIVIGGGVSKAGEILIDFIRPHYEKNVFHGSRQVKFSLATLGNDAGIYGAAKLVLDAVENK